jgi:hypothetical protein
MRCELAHGLVGVHDPRQDVAPRRIGERAEQLVQALRRWLPIYNHMVVDNNTPGTGEAMSELPVACSLDPAALEARREGLVADLLQRAEAHEVLPNGHRLRFAAADDTLGLIARAIDGERRCCRFLRFHVTVEPDEGPIVLDLTGPEGTRDFLTALMAG